MSVTKRKQVQRFECFRHSVFLGKKFRLCVDRYTIGFIYN